jgi:hypothetical protein
MNINQNDLKSVHKRLRSALTGLAANILPSMGNVWYVNGWDGSDTLNSGSSPDSAFKTMAHAFTVLASNDTIYLTGRITEQIVAPLGVYDVSIIGCTSNPRQSTNNGVQAGYSAYWKYLTANVATANLELIEQGWTIQNIVFEPTATGTGILLTRAEDAVHPDPSHAVITGCRFVGGAYGVKSVDGTFNLRITDNVFQTQTTYAIAVVAGVGIANPAQWHITDNHFRDFTGGVLIPGANGMKIKGNFFTDGGTPNATVVLSLTGGDNNFVIDNYFQTTTANFNAPDIVGNATDVWNNVSIDGQASSIGREIGTPA